MMVTLEHAENKTLMAMAPPKTKWS